MPVDSIELDSIPNDLRIEYREAEFAAYAASQAIFDAQRRESALHGEFNDATHIGRQIGSAISAKLEEQLGDDLTDARVQVALHDDEQFQTNEEHLKKLRTDGELATHELELAKMHYELTLRRLDFLTALAERVR